MAAARTLDARILSRAMGYLFLAGATIGAISMLLPHAADASELGLWSNIALAYAGGGSILAFGPRFPDWFFHVTLATGTLLIARAVYLSGEEVSFYSAWFIWIGLIGFYFFSRAAAAATSASPHSSTRDADRRAREALRWRAGSRRSQPSSLQACSSTRSCDGRARRRRQPTRAREHERRSPTSPTSSPGSPIAPRPDRRCARRARRAGAEHAPSSLWVPSATGSSLDLVAAGGPRPTQRALPFVGPRPAARCAPSRRRECIRAHGEEQVDGPSPGIPGRQMTFPGDVIWQPVLRDGDAVAVTRASTGASLDATAEEAGLVTLTDLLAAETAVTLQRVDLLEPPRDGRPHRRPHRPAQPPRLAGGAAAEIDRARRERLPAVRRDARPRPLQGVQRRAGPPGGRPAAQAGRGAPGPRSCAPPTCSPATAARSSRSRCPAAARSRRSRWSSACVRVTPEGQTCSAGVVWWDGEETASRSRGPRRRRPLRGQARRPRPHDPRDDPAAAGE